MPRPKPGWALPFALIGLVGCNGSAETTARPSIPTSEASEDCTHLLGMTAVEAAALFDDLGVSVSWRLEYTDPDTGAIAKPVATPPAGTVTNVVSDDGTVVVSVSSDDDPLQAFVPESVTCPA